MPLTATLRLYQRLNMGLIQMNRREYMSIIPQNSMYSSVVGIRVKDNS